MSKRIEPGALQVEGVITARPSANRAFQISRSGSNHAGLSIANGDRTYGIAIDATGAVLKIQEDADGSPRVHIDAANNQVGFVTIRCISGGGVTLTTTLDARCRDCGYRFTYDPQFYESRALKPPQRCARCRAARKAARTECTTWLYGRVTAVLPHDALVITADNELEFFARREHVAPADWPTLTVGSRVSFEAAADHADYARPDRRPRAYVVRAETA